MLSHWFFPLYTWCMLIYYFCSNRKSSTIAQHTENIFERTTKGTRMRRVDKLKANWIKTEHENAPQVEAQHKISNDKRTNNKTNESTSKTETRRERKRNWKGDRQKERVREREIVQSAPIQCTRHTAAVDWNTNWKQQLNAQQTRKERETERVRRERE